MCLLKKNMKNKYEGFKAFGDNVSFIVGMSVRNFFAAQCSAFFVISAGGWLLF